MLMSPYDNHIICSYVKHMFDICETYVRQYVYIAFNAYPPLVKVLLLKKKPTDCFMGNQLLFMLFAYIVLF